MAKCGSTPMPISPGSSKRIEFRLVSRSLSSVVHCWPVALTYCRSSSQMAQTAGGCSLSACCVPQVVQMKFGMVFMLNVNYECDFPVWPQFALLNCSDPPLGIVSVFQFSPAWIRAT